MKMRFLPAAWLLLVAASAAQATTAEDKVNAAAKAASGVATKVENAVKKGAKAAEKGIQTGVKAANKGADAAARKVGIDPARPASSAAGQTKAP